LPVREQARVARLIDHAAQLAEAPPKAAARIVGHIPEQLAKPLPPVRAAAHDQVGQQSPRLLGGRQLELLLAAPHLYFSE